MKLRFFIRWLLLDTFSIQRKKRFLKHSANKTAGEIDRDINSKVERSLNAARQKLAIFVLFFTSITNNALSAKSIVILLLLTTITCLIRRTDETL